METIQSCKIWPKFSCFHIHVVCTDCLPFHPHRYLQSLKCPFTPSATFSTLALCFCSRSLFALKNWAIFHECCARGWRMSVGIPRIVPVLFRTAHQHRIIENVFKWLWPFATLNEDHWAFNLLLDYAASSLHTSSRASFSQRSDGKGRSQWTGPWRGPKSILQLILIECRARERDLKARKSESLRHYCCRSRSKCFPRFVINASRELASFD